MTTQRAGRRRDPVRAFINANPARGVSVAEIASATGMSQLAAEYAICYLCNAGEAVRMRRGRARLYFGSQDLADAYADSFPYEPPARKKKGYGKTPARRKAIAAYMAKNPGGSAADVARGIGVAMETVRGMLVDMRRDGEAYAAGPATRPRWYASREAMDADQAAARAAEEVRKAAIVKHKARGGRACAAKKSAFVIVSKALGEKSAAERTRPAPERLPVEIIGMDGALKKCKPAEKYPDHRFVVTGPVVGGFATMGIGRYLEAQS